MQRPQTAAASALHDGSDEVRYITGVDIP